MGRIVRMLPNPPMKLKQLSDALQVICDDIPLDYHLI